VKLQNKVKFIVFLNLNFFAKAI